MRVIIYLLFVCIPSIALSGEVQDTLKNKIKADAVLSFNSNGIASVPAFSLGKPALVSSVTLSKGRFSYDPTLGYSMEMKPWYIDNWFRYKFILRPKFEMKAGVDFSTFFSEFVTNDEKILKAERYFAFSIAGTYKFSPVSSLTLDYWSDNGQEKGTMTGHFIYLAYDQSEINFGENVFLSVNLMLFYVNYTGKNDGLFVSPKSSLSVKNIPVSIFFQATQAIKSNISPWPGFKYNVGISYKL